MVKRKWQLFAGRLKALSLSRAEATRATGIHYSRLVGFLNGYWDLSPEEEKALDSYLSEKEQVTRA